MKTHALYDLLAPAYGKLIPQFTALTVSRAVRRVMAGSPASLVELGVGTGRSFAELRKKSPVRVVAADISQKMLQMARKEAKKAGVTAGLAQSDVMHLPFRDGEFDAALSTFLVNLLTPSDVTAALSEMIRIVAPGGRLVIAHLDIQSPGLRKAWHFADRIFPDTFGIMRPLDMTDFYVEAGLRVVRNESVQESLGTRVTTLVKVVG